MAEQLEPERMLFLSRESDKGTEYYAYGYLSHDTDTDAHCHCGVKTLER